MSIIIVILMETFMGDINYLIQPNILYPLLANPWGH